MSKKLQTMWKKNHDSVKHFKFCVLNININLFNEIKSLLGLFFQADSGMPNAFGKHTRRNVSEYSLYHQKLFMVSSAKSTAGNSNTCTEMLGGRNSTLLYYDKIARYENG